MFGWVNKIIENILNWIYSQIILYDFIYNIFQDAFDLKSFSSMRLKAFWLLIQ